MFGWADVFPAVYSPVKHSLGLHVPPFSQGRGEAPPGCAPDPFEPQPYTRETCPHPPYCPAIPPKRRNKQSTPQCWMGAHQQAWAAQPASSNRWRACQLQPAAVHASCSGQGDSPCLQRCSRVLMALAKQRMGRGAHLQATHDTGVTVRHVLAEDGDLHHAGAAQGVLKVDVLCRGAEGQGSRGIRQADWVAHSVGGRAVGQKLHAAATAITALAGQGLAAARVGRAAALRHARSYIGGLLLTCQALVMLKQLGSASF